MRVSDLAKEIKQPFDPKKSTEELLYIGLEHILPKVLHIDSYSYSNNTESLKYRFNQGDILFGTMRPYFKKLVRAPFNGVCSTEISVIRSKQRIDTNYIFYLLAQDSFIKFCNVNSRGDRPRTKWKHFSKFQVNHENEANRFIIGDVLFAYDDLIDTNRRRIQLLEEAARLLFREWFEYFRFPGHEKVKFEDRDGIQIPVGWGREKLNKYVSFKRGVEPGTDNYLEIQEDDTFPFYRVSDLVTRKPEIFVDELYTKGALLEKKDIVVSLDGSVGIVSMGLDGCYSTGIRKLVIKGKRINRSFLYYLMKSHYIQGIINAYAKGTTIQHAGESIKHMNPILPPQNLMDKFGEIVEAVINEMLTLLNQNQKLAQARDLLLPRLMSGKIDVSKIDMKVVQEA